LFSLDTIVLYEFGDKRYIVTAVEHTSKLAYAKVYSSHASAAARDFLLRLRYLVGDYLQVVLTDNGSEFQQYFQEECVKLGITRYYTRPRTPKDNPEVERFNRTIQEEWLNEGNWYRDIRSMNQSLTDWLILYHNLRPHQTLKYQTPLAHAITKGIWSKRSSSSTGP
jgi:transposase InsO family protein